MRQTGRQTGGIHLSFLIFAFYPAVVFIDLGYVKEAVSMFRLLQWIVNANTNRKAVVPLKTVNRLSKGIMRSVN